MDSLSSESHLPPRETSDKSFAVIIVCPGFSSSLRSVYIYPQTGILNNESFQYFLSMMTYIPKEVFGLATLLTDCLSFWPRGSERRPTRTYRNLILLSSQSIDRRVSPTNRFLPFLLTDRAGEGGGTYQKWMFFVRVDANDHEAPYQFSS